MFAGGAEIKSQAGGVAKMRRRRGERGTFRKGTICGNSAKFLQRGPENAKMTSSTGRSKSSGTSTATVMT